MKKPAFISNEIYHIYNRGVEKRTIFLDNKDYLRFIHDLWEFNNAKEIKQSNTRFISRKPATVSENNMITATQRLEVQPPNVGLVEIIAFCLMPNHYHLLLRQSSENGIVKFMQKIGTGYTMYFNQKNQRVGHLFQGRFKAILINSNRHLLHMPNYIHLNPLDLIEPGWRKNKITNPKKSLAYLQKYRWSSLLDYINIKNFPSIINRKLLKEILGSPSHYKKHLFDWIREMDQEEINRISLE